MNNQKTKIEAQPTIQVQQIVSVLDELEHTAFEKKMERVRRRDDVGEKQWQFYRDALLKVARDLKIDWHPTYF